MWKPCVLIFHLVVISPRHDVSLQVISCLQLSPFFFALTHCRQQTQSFLAIFLFLSTFSFLQLYEMSVCWMKFGFQLSGTHRPVSHTHTALGLISFANIASPNTTSETHSLALLPWEKGDPQFFLPGKVISHCNVVHVYDWFKSLILEWLWSNIQQECIWGTVSHYDFFVIELWFISHSIQNPKYWFKFTNIIRDCS